MQRRTRALFAPAARAFSFLVLTAAFSVSAAAQPPPPGPPLGPPARPPPHACFWIRNISNFAATDTTSVYLRVGVREIWRLQLFADCFNVDWVHHLGISARGVSSNVCEGRNPGIDVVVRDVAFGRQRCPVIDVRRLTPDEVAALPKGARP